MMFTNGHTHFYFRYLVYQNQIYRTVTVYGNSEILHGSDVFARRRKLFKPESIFKQTRVNFFTPKIWRHFLISSQLR